MHDFVWSKECHLAFKELKKFLASPPLLSKPRPGEEIFLYLAPTMEAISFMLVRVNKRPIYYISKVLHNTKTRYSNIKKIVFTLIDSTQHLKPYFQNHPIIVLTNMLLKDILH